MKKNVQYGPNYTVFLGLMKRSEPGMDRGSFFIRNLSINEIRLLNGYQINTGDYDVSIKQVYNLNSVTFCTKQSTFDLAAYCMELDKKNV